MPAKTVEECLYQEKDRLQRAFSHIASDLSAFFERGRIPAATDALQQVLDTTREILNAEKCALFLVDIAERSLILERASGAVEFGKLKDVGTYEIAPYEPARSGTGVTPWVWYRKQPFNARSFDELVHNSEGHWRGNWDAAMYGGSDKATLGFKCVYMVPLLTGSRCIGVLKYENRTDGKRFFDSHDERLIDMIAALVTNLVVSQRIERNRYDKMLPTISEVLVSSFGRSTFYERLLEQCRQLLSADLCSLFLVDNQDNLVLRAIVGTLSEAERQQLTGFHYENYKISPGLTPWILRVGTSFNVRNFPDLKARSEGNHWGHWDNILYHGRPQEEFKSLYSIPLIVGSNRIGVLKVENKNVPPYYFTESDEALFDLIGRVIAIGVIYDTEKYLGTLIRGAELGFLAAGISHEFNTYLSRFLVLLANIRDLCRDVPSVGPRISELQREIHAAESVIEHIRNVRNRQESTKAFAPDDLVQDVLVLCKRRFEGHSVDVHYQNDGVRQLWLDPADFQTIVVNLIKNAFESVAEKEAPGFVRVSLGCAPADHFRLVVEDSGKGIPEGQEDHLFLPFFTTKAPAGMGFGLYGVQHIVQANGGEIKIVPRNKFGGATFEITLPTRRDSRRSDK